MKDINKINFEKAREDYQNIFAGAEFKENILKNIRKKERGIVMKKFISLSASIAAAAVIVFNVSPSLSYAAAEIPVLGSVVRVMTFGRYEISDNGYEAKVITPKIEGLIDKELEDKLNEEFKENAKSVIYAYEQDVKALKEEFGSETVHMGVNSNYTVKTDTSDILALDVYIAHTAGSSSSIHSFYTINKKTGELLSLKGLFKENSDYISPISEYIKDEMQRRNKEEDGMFWIGKQEEGFDGFEKIKPDQNFYIDNNNNLVICFDKYEVAAGAQGSPEFTIPDNVIKDILK